MTTSIRQTVTIAAKPGVIFEALMDSKKHTAFTGAPAKISRKPGGAFTCYGQYISGITIATTTNKSIIQAWRASGWPKGEYSILTYRLQSAKGGKTKLTLEQHGVPRKENKGIAEGWRVAYWDKLKEMAEAAKAGAKPAAKAKPKPKPKPKKKPKAKPRAKPKKKAAKRKAPAKKRTARAKK